MLRNGLHPADLHPHNHEAAGGSGGHDGDSGGAEYVTEQIKKKQEVPAKTGASCQLFAGIIGNPVEGGAFNIFTT